MTSRQGAFPALPDRLFPELEGVETPQAVVDAGTVRRNATRAVAYCDRWNLRWRPHVKTHKCLNVARLQVEAGAHGLTVATPREAEVMSRVTDDLLLAYPPLGAAKVGRLLALPSGVDLKVALDSRVVLRALAHASAAAGRETGVLVELDVGMGRVGVQGPDGVLDLAREVKHLDGVRFRGILFYPGHIRTPGQEQVEALAEVAARLEETCERLAGAGLSPEIVSGGSTPTLWKSHHIPHLTEVRAGTWIFNDRDILAQGTADPSDCAYSVLATVVSTAVPGQAVVDAGSKTLAKEGRGGDGSFGLVLDHPEVHVVGLSEEHGILDLSRADWRPRVGDRVRILPNHVCVSVNLQDELLVVSEAGLEAWPLEARGRGPWT